MFHGIKNSWDLIKESYQRVVDEYNEAQEEH